MSSKRPDHLNISIKPELKADFDKYSAKYGTNFSTWIAEKMREFIEEEKIRRKE